MPDDILALIETDKVTIDVRYTGSKPAVLKSLSLAPEDTVTVGQTVAVFDDDPAAVEAAGGAPTGSSKSEPVRLHSPLLPSARQTPQYSYKRRAL